MRVTTVGCGILRLSCARSRMVRARRSGTSASTARAFVLALGTALAIAGHPAGSAAAQQARDTSATHAPNTTPGLQTPARVDAGRATSETAIERGARQTVKRSGGDGGQQGTVGPPSGFQPPGGFPKPPEPGSPADGGPSGPSGSAGPSGGPGPGAPDGPSGGGGSSGGPSGPSDPSGVFPGGGWCPVDIGDLLTPSGVDLSARGFELRPLGPDFVATDFALRGACPQGASTNAGADPTSTEGVIAVDRSYRYGDDSGLWLAQQQEAERTVDALYATGATFWSRGSTFTLWAWGAPVVGIPSGVEDAGALVERAIGELAPELALECFYRESSGDWSDLPSLGIGDPRAALPPDVEQTWFYLYLFEDPPPACGALDVDMPVYFAANFGGDGGWVGTSAWPRWDYGVPGTGTIDDVSVWWSNERYQFSAYSYGNGTGADSARLIELAQALDPTLDPRCLRRWRQLAAAELAELGLPRANAPAGWQRREEHLQAAIAQEGCAVDPQTNLTYWLSWLFDDTDDDGSQRFLGATANRDASWLEASAVSPWIQGSWIYWRDSSGTWYSVYGYAVDGSDPPPFEDLAAVARSLDPDVDLP